VRSPDGVADAHDAFGDVTGRQQDLHLVRTPGIAAIAELGHCLNIAT
jgi:hypothetical protein